VSAVDIGFLSPAQSPLKSRKKTWTSSPTCTSHLWPHCFNPAHSISFPSARMKSDVRDGVRERERERLSLNR